MNKFYFICILSFMSTFLFGQNANYSKILFDKDKFDLSVSKSTITSSKEVIIVGNNDIIKFDSSCNLIWSRSVLENNYIVSLKNIAQLSDSSFVIVGDLLLENGNFDKGLVLRIDENGEIIWSRTFSDDNNTTSLNSAIKGTNEHIYIAGNFTNKKNSSTSIIVFEMDTMGNIVWSKNYLGAKLSNPINLKVTNIKQSEGQSLFIMGKTVDSQSFINNALVYKVEKDNGHISWSKIYYKDRNSNDFGIDFEVDKSSVILLSNGAISKLDTFGNIIWSRFYDQLTYLVASEETDRKLVKTSDNGFIAILGNKYVGSISKYDSIGTGIWAKRITMDPVDLHKISDSSYIILGNGPLSGFLKSGGNNIKKIGILKTSFDKILNDCISDANVKVLDDSLIAKDFNLDAKITGNLGDIILNTSNDLVAISDGCIDSENGIFDLTKNPKFDVFPNPSDDYLIINSSLNEVIENVEIFDFIGNSIGKVSNYTLNSKLYLNNVTTGINIIRFQYLNKFYYLKFLKI